MTKKRHLTITLQADWQGALRAVKGGLLCLFASLHIDMHLEAAA